jgi:hypothetical protein
VTDSAALPSRIDGAATTVLSFAATSLSRFIAAQFAPPDLAFQPELIDWFLAVNGAAASLYFLQILAGAWARRTRRL